MKLEFTEEQLRLLSIAVEAYVGREEFSCSNQDDDAAIGKTSNVPAAWKRLAEKLRAIRPDEDAGEVWADYAKSRKVPSNPAQAAGPLG